MLAALRRMVDTGLEIDLMGHLKMEGIGMVVGRLKTGIDMVVGHLRMETDMVVDRPKTATDMAADRLKMEIDMVVDHLKTEIDMAVAHRMEEIIALEQSLRVVIIDSARHHKDAIIRLQLHPEAKIIDSALPLVETDLVLLHPQMKIGMRQETMEMLEDSVKIGMGIQALKGLKAAQDTERAVTAT